MSVAGLEEKGKAARLTSMASPDEQAKALSDLHIKIESEAIKKLAKELAAVTAVKEQLETALQGLVACCEKLPAFTKQNNLITRGRYAAALSALSKAKGE